MHFIGQPSTPPPFLCLRGWRWTVSTAYPRRYYVITLCVATLLARSAVNFHPHSCALGAGGGFWPLQSPRIFAGESRYYVIASLRYWHGPPFLCRWSCRWILASPVSIILFIGESHYYVIASPRYWLINLRDLPCMLSSAVTSFNLSAAAHTGTSSTDKHAL